MKIADFSARFFDEKNAGRGVPALQAKFPKTVEASRGNAGKIERGGTVAADSVGTQCEIVVVMNVGTSLAFVNGKAGAEETGGKSRNFGDGDFVAVKCCAFAAGGSVELLVNRVVNHTDKNLIVVRKSDRYTEAWVAVSEVRCAVERINVPAKFGVVV